MMSAGKVIMPAKEAAKYYYFTFGTEDQHVFVAQHLGCGQCQWKFLCSWCGHHDGDKWFIHHTWGLAAIRQDKSYRELTEREMLRWFLKGEGYK